jgi:Cu2+-exporting ATPase
MVEIVLTVLVVSCPCALSLAAPAAFAAAGSHLVQRGVLLTRGHALETLAKVTHFVFDKTGTLTLGHLTLQNSRAYSEIVAECLKIAASLEKNSEHALAKPFIAATKHQALYPVADAKNIPGQGVQGSINGQVYTLGNTKLHQHLLDDLSLNNSKFASELGATVVWLCDEKRVLAAFALADQLRPQAQQMMEKLKARGLHVAILSGDSESAVSSFAQKVGVQEWQAACSPEQKLAYLHALQAKGAVVAMVGDGINDAPVLAGAQVSIAMGSGTQMARATGDVVLLSENLLEIDHAVERSRFAINVVRENFAWALVYNLIALPFAASGAISPWMAAIGMSVSSLIVVLNALRLK